jgi:hypothetical protein
MAMISDAIARALPRAAMLAAWYLAATPAAAQEVARAREQGQACMTQRNYACAEAAFGRMIRLRPADPAGYAMRGIAYTRMERYREAIADLERAMDMGEGTWDIVANYAEALQHTGRTAEAIDWSYRALTIVPTLVDVRGDLATMLVGQGRHHEALSLLGAFDATTERRGQKPYFAARRMVIEQALQRRGAAQPAGLPALRLPKLEDFFHAPVSLAEGRFAPFVVDTGASTTVLSRTMLAESRAAHSITRATARSRLADGRTVEGQVVTLARLAVGPHELKDVPAFVCDRCAALLGQDVLKHFDLQSSRQAGVEFLTMTPRATPGR